MKRNLLIFGISVLILGILVGAYFWLCSNEKEKEEIQEVAKLEGNVPFYIALKNSSDFYELVMLEGKENTIDYIIKVYNEYSYALPTNYENPLTFSSFSYLRNEDLLQIIINESVEESDENIEDFLSALYLSCKEHNINEVRAYYNGKEYFVNKKTLINVMFDATDYYKLNTSVIYHKNGDNYIPVTYLHNSDPIDYVLNKLISFPYTYEIDDAVMTMKIERFDKMPDDKLNEIETSLIYMDVIESLIINNEDGSVEKIID